MVTVVCVVAMLCACALGDWTTGTSVPSYGSSGGAVVVSGYVVWMVGTAAHRYDPAADTWSAFNTMPTNRYIFAIASVGAYGFVISGYFGSNRPEVEEFDAQGNWVSKTDITTPLRRISGASSTEVVWGLGGVTGSTGLTHVQEYSVASDAWTLRRPMPVGTAEAAASHTEGFLVVCGGQSPSASTAQVYNVAQDSWTSAPDTPTSRMSIYQGGAALGGFHFFLGGPGSTKLERYHPLSDSWTSLPSPPRPHSHALTMLSSGVLVAVGAAPSTTAVHLFLAAVGASVLGDPVFTSFTGVSHHFDLQPSVVTVLATPWLVVNTLVDGLDGLPAEENLVIVSVGIVARVLGSVLQVCCDIHEASNALRCRSSFPADHPSPESSLKANAFLKQRSEGSVVVVLPTTSVMVTGRLQATMQCPTCSPSAYLDVHVAPLSHHHVSPPTPCAGQNTPPPTPCAGQNTAPPAHPCVHYGKVTCADEGCDGAATKDLRVAGLLGDLDTIGEQAAKERLAIGWYRVEGSVLDVASAACSVFVLP